MAYGILYSLRFERQDSPVEPVNLSGQEYSMECNWLEVESKGQLTDENTLVELASDLVKNCIAKEGQAPRYIQAARLTNGEVEVRHKW